MIKVLHVTPQMDFGGVASVVRNFYSALNHDEIIFDFVTHGPVETYHHEMTENGSTFFYFKTVGQIGLHNYQKQIKAHINVKEYDVIHVHVGDLTGVYALLFRMCGAKTIINHGHGSKPVSDNRKNIEFILRYLARKEADVCIGCGKDAGDFMFGKGKYILLPNGIDFSRFSNPNIEKVNELKKRFKTDNRIVLTNIGNLQRVKNQMFLIDVINSVRHLVPDILLIIAGEGPERGSIENKIHQLDLQNNVFLAGTVTEIPELLHISDMFMLPSLHEGIPLSAIEAQATGIPCLLSNRIDHDIDIGNGNVFFISIDEGSENWKERLLLLVKNKNNRVKNNEGIHERLILKGYDINENALRLMSIYSELSNR